VPAARVQEPGVPIEPEALRWAMRRAGVDETNLAKAVRVKSAETVRAWLRGQSRPTHSQTHKLARRLLVPFPILLLPPPKAETELPLRDFRRGPRGQPSLELRETVFDALRKRDWYREYRREPNPLVGAFKEHDPLQAAQNIRMRLGLESWRQRPRSWSEFRSVFAKAIEDRLDILVLMNSVLGNDTRRPLDAEEFAGFALADPIAPLIFVNTRGSVARSIFTMGHELGHILIAENALDSDPLPDEDSSVERWCDRFAAELLMPREAFIADWGSSPTRDLAERCQELARRYHVSARAVLVRAREMSLIPRELVRGIRDTLVAAETVEHSAAEGRGNFSTLVRVRNSRKLSEKILEATCDGALSYTSAARLLNIRPSSLVALLNRESGSEAHAS
jgi:Zn-dependent peptidase ImmA (M78 family)